jgi:hypothetical protein
MIDDRGEAFLPNTLAPQQTQVKSGDEGENERAVTINFNNVSYTCIGVTGEVVEGEEVNKQNKRNEKRWGKIHTTLFNQTQVHTMPPLRDSWPR